MDPITAGRLAETAAAVEKRLEALLDAPADVPERLAAAMRHAVLGGGKRLRPVLVVETARLFGAADARAIEVGAALECVHGYSLVHDDLPAMDDDALRRGRPTVHVAYDQATAILVGDALQALAFELLAGPSADPDPAVRTALIAGLARAAGGAGMVGGQLLDLAAEGRFGAVAFGVEEVRRLQAMKTGALFAFAVAAGALLGRAGPQQTAALDTYADHLGFAFQIADDLLDAEGDAAVVGKATGKDAAAGKATLIGLMGLQGARDALARTIAAGEAALGPFGARAETLAAVIRYVGGRAV